MDLIIHSFNKANPFNKIKICNKINKILYNNKINLKLIISMYFKIQIKINNLL